MVSTAAGLLQPSWPLHDAWPAEPRSTGATTIWTTIDRIMCTLHHGSWIPAETKKSANAPVKGLANRCSCAPPGNHFAFLSDLVARSRRERGPIGGASDRYCSWIATRRPQDE